MNRDKTPPKKAIQSYWLPKLTNYGKSQPQLRDQEFVRRSPRSERTSAVLQQRKSNGIIYTPQIMGFDNVDGKIIRNEREQRLVASIFRLRKKGQSMQKIADYLNTYTRSKNNCKFYPSTIRYILNNDIYPMSSKVKKVDCKQNDFCFACGLVKMVTRCHIKAVSDEGVNRVPNIHLLCVCCHDESEMLSDDTYWRWFEDKSESDALEYYRNFIRKYTSG